MKQKGVNVDSDRRRAQRYSINTDCVLYIDGIEGEFHCDIKDLSARGIGISTDMNNLEGRKVMLVFIEDTEEYQKYFGDDYFRCEGVIVRNKNGNMGILLKPDPKIEKYLERKETLRYINCLKLYD